MSRVALIVSGILVAVACVVAGAQLWETIVPAGLRLDPEAAARTFPAEATAEAEGFEALIRWLFIATQL